MDLAEWTKDFPALLLLLLPLWASQPPLRQQMTRRPNARRTERTRRRRANFRKRVILLRRSKVGFLVTIIISGTQKWYPSLSSSSWPFLLMHEKKASQISDRLFIKFITKSSSSPASSFAFFPQQALVNKQQFAMTDWLNNVGLLCTHNTTKSDEELFSTLAEAYCQTFFSLSGQYALKK